MDTGKPYKNIEITDTYIIRKFSNDIDINELLWHRDNEGRIITPLIENDWYIQLDNELPQQIKGDIEIPKHMWHRVIKGSTDLIIKIFLI